jgi:hypothetical protein
MNHVIHIVTSISAIKKKSTTHNSNIVRLKDVTSSYKEVVTI